ncbi:hypothetical protein RN001_001115 [Aquatica leii]|uniref:THAP-type domain-containing protein n=1 Tax=Aquatica leii TaxID=1421715 RepID=A0AAN7PFQ4_9COLE|nr:hypothetical protein RN001_001115 [Aquatica leii]
MDSKNRKCNVNCCVYICHSRKDREINLSFHRFPKARSEKVDRLKAWELKLLMGKRPTSCLRVCSIHFIENDFILPGTECKNRKSSRVRSGSVNGFGDLTSLWRSLENTEVLEDIFYP